ncbi:MAG: DUF1800 domain-containing protein [Blastocatellia bacterium]
MRTDLRRLPFFLALIFLSAITFSAQEDPNPDSPVPVLLSGTDSSRVLAVRSRSVRGRIPTFGNQVFVPSRNTEISIFVRNLDLMQDEEANSVRVYLRQRSGKTFELQTVDLTPADKSSHAIKIRLFDPNGYRGQPLADGDSLIYVTWRGLLSNILRIGLGSAGNGIEIPSDLKVLSTMKEVPTNEYVGYRWSGDRIRFLEQATFGPTSELDNRIRRIGLRTWLAEQLEMPYPTYPYPNPPQMPTIPPADCALNTNPTCYRDRYTMIPLQKWFFNEAMYGNSQLRHRVAWALSQIWVTSGNTVTQASHQIAYNKILSDNAFGNYRTLLQEGTLSPTMGHYLDMVRSTRTNPNENFPREILQLFSIGLFMLNQDGTLRLDNQGQPIPTYDQQTINNLSKVFTGWTYCNVGCPNALPGILNYKDPMTVNPANHDLTAKTLMNYPNAVNTEIAACTDCTTPEATRAYAETSLNRSLDNIFYHPNVGPYIGRLLIQHLVTSDPSPAYVGRVSAAFNDNGQGVRGDMRSVIRAILLDPEARGNIKTAPRYGKLREPVQLISNLTRIFPARDFSGESLSDGALASHVTKLGQNPFNSPTVFNYFSPDFVVPGTTVNAPEFEILNTGFSVGRTNLLHTLIFEGITANATDSLRGTSLTYSEVLPFAESDPTGNALLDVLNNKMMHGAMLEAQRNSILTAVQAVPATNPLYRVKTAVYLIAASSHYQIQR